MTPSAWSIQRIRDLTEKKFGKRACLFQLNVARSLYEKQHDVVAIAATGSGKTLSFWIPLLMALEDKQDKMIFVVTPLNILGRQNVEILGAAGISAVAVDAQIDPELEIQDIEAGRHQVVVINPEVLMRSKGHCDKLWKNSDFTSRILYFVFDEGHCISEWSAFREQYKHVGSLRYLIPDSIPFYVASATLPTPVLSDVTDLLNLRPNQTDHIFRSNDRPDIAIGVRRMRHAADSYHDLDFLIPDNFKDGDPPPPKFLIFFNNIREAESAAQHLRSRLPEHLRQKVKWFHSIMSDKYRNDEFEALKNSDVFGLCVTDSFGMGLDLSDIKLIIQWKVPSSLNTLWQRFGRAARGDGFQGFAILIAEKALWDSEIQKRNRRKAQAAAPKKRKRKNTSKKPSKRRRLGDMQASRTGAVTLLQPVSGASGDLSGDDDVANLDIPETIQPALNADTVKKELKTVQPALLDLVNAKSRGLKCRRTPITLFYSNDKRSM
ncbi:hypothetical protein CERSUDRAFT_55318 [Gelatoporia subvermispora B]|uniref:DNA 3'-5' helicase n=1 Tax=Ceriporiopsis subvermispora (strain B) TaxID=914234 RepID=M2QB84_CERS8|nr:hypothetical protein CERSUDRAFT_55318 [Gelatoporia subvermispora B]